MPVFKPSELRIQRMCAKIQMEWTPEEEECRRVQDMDDLIVPFRNLPSLLQEFIELRNAG